MPVVVGSHTVVGELPVPDYPSAMGLEPGLGLAPAKAAGSSVDSATGRCGAAGRSVAAGRTSRAGGRGTEIGRPGRRGSAPRQRRTTTRWPARPRQLHAVAAATQASIGCRSRARCRR